MMLINIYFTMITKKTKKNTKKYIYFKKSDKKTDSRITHNE